MKLKYVPLLLLLPALIVVLAGCGGDSQPLDTPATLPIATPMTYPTYTPYPTFTLVFPTVTPYPTYTPVPPTVTPTATPTATVILIPMPTSAAVPTPKPTPTPTVPTPTATLIQTTVPTAMPITFDAMYSWQSTTGTQQFWTEYFNISQVPWKVTLFYRASGSYPESATLTVNILQEHAIIATLDPRFEEGFAEVVLELTGRFTFQILSSQVSYWMVSVLGASLDIPQPTHSAPSGDGGGIATTPQSFGGGVWVVGRDIATGLYRNTESSGGCYWARLSGFGGTIDEIIANSFSNDIQTVRISSTDAGFESSRCGSWISIED